MLPSVRPLLLRWSRGADSSRTLPLPKDATVTSFLCPWTAARSPAARPILAAGRKPVTATAQTLSESEVELAMAVLTQLRQSGQVEQEKLIRKLMARADARLAELLEPWSEDDLTDEDKSALRRGLAGIDTGRVVPDEVVNQGRNAVLAYRRRRDAGELSPPNA